MTFIAHASIPADDPASAAQFLAEMMDGEALRFPPAGPDAWMAWSRDGDVHLEIVPRGHLIRRDPEEGAWRAGSEATRGSEVHLALCVDRPAAEIREIAGRAGWPARHCERGGGVFSLTEVWIDGCFMVEVLDPEQTRIYGERITRESWKRHLPMMDAAPAAQAEPI